MLSALQLLSVQQPFSVRPAARKIQPEEQRATETQSLQRQRSFFIPKVVEIIIKKDRPIMKCQLDD